MASRLEREKKTVEMMIQLYCKDHHHPNEALCPACQTMKDYAMARLGHCKFGEGKPTCGKCTVHCYKPDMRKRIVEVMRYSGPKMIFVHPVAAVQHLLDGFKKS